MLTIFQTTREPNATSSTTQTSSRPIRRGAGRPAPDHRQSLQSSAGLAADRRRMGPHAARQFLTCRASRKIVIVGRIRCGSRARRSRRRTTAPGISSIRPQPDEPAVTHFIGRTDSPRESRVMQRERRTPAAPIARAPRTLLGRSRAAVAAQAGYAGARRMTTIIRHSASPSAMARRSLNAGAGVDRTMCSTRLGVGACGKARLGRRRKQANPARLSRNARHRLSRPSQ